MAKYIYKGGGYFAGLPARDMTEDEWESYPEGLTKAGMDANLYEIEFEQSDYSEDEVKDA